MWNQPGLSSLILCAALLYPCQSFIPELSGKAFVPPDSRKQQAPKLFHSPWKQQQRPWFLLTWRTRMPFTWHGTSRWASLSCGFATRSAKPRFQKRDFCLFSKSFSQHSIFNSKKKKRKKWFALRKKEKVGLSHSIWALNNRHFTLLVRKSQMKGQISFIQRGFLFWISEWADHQILSSIPDDN